MRIAVTGASGFVGRAVVQAAHEAGWRVRAVLRQATPAAMLPRDVECVGLGDLGGPVAWDGVLDGCDCVIHAAAHVHRLKPEAADAERFRAVNVEGTRRLGAAAHRAGVPHVVFVSSIAVHGDAWLHGPLTEALAATPNTDYGRSKADAEVALQAEFGGRADETLTILRPPLVYGPHAPGNFARLVRLVRSGIPLPFGLARTPRSVLGVGNLADLIRHAAAHRARAGGTFLCADAAPVTLPSLIAWIAAGVQRPARLVPVPPALLLAGASLLGRRRLMAQLLQGPLLDLSLVQQQLGWRAPASTDVGVRDAARATTEAA